MWKWEKFLEKEKNIFTFKYEIKPKQDEIGLLEVVKNMFICPKQTDTEIKEIHEKET